MDQSHDLLITGADVLTDPWTLVESARVLVRQGKIVSVTTADESAPHPSATDHTNDRIRQISLPGRLIIPGLVNLHTHAALCMLRGVAEDLGFAPAYTPGMPGGGDLTPGEACALARTRTQTVFADGPERAELMFVGEAPGENEDRQGVPFVGEAGKLLTDIIEKGMGLSRSTVVIANVLKCRPPENRDPSAEETRTCTPWLDRQIELVNPKVLVPLGKHASNHLLGIAGPELRSMGSLRERVHEHAGRKLVPTFHPSYLLRTPEAKKDCWKDIQLAMGLLGLSPRRNG